MGEAPKVLDDWAKTSWYTDYGALPMVTVGRVRWAMTSMFWFRVYYDLEIAASVEIQA